VPAAVASRWIKIQRVGLDLTRVNTGQTGMTLSFCRKLPELFGFTKLPSSNSDFLYS
jgi:hypothetical protein